MKRVSDEKLMKVYRKELMKFLNLFRKIQPVLNNMGDVEIDDEESGKKFLMNARGKVWMLMQNDYTPEEFSFVFNLAERLKMIEFQEE